MPAHRPAPVPATPVDGFSKCHAGIVSGLAAFRELPALQDAAHRARELARKTLALLDDAVLEHHADEERDLFVAVLRSATPGAEQQRVQEMVKRLTAQHREIEALWKLVRPAVQHAASGRDTTLDIVAVNDLAQAYGDHAWLEETAFLPLAQEILGRNKDHMEALAISLHMAHARVPVGYV